MTRDELFDAMCHRKEGDPSYYIKVGNSREEFACAFELLSCMYDYGIVTQRKPLAEYISAIKCAAYDKGITLYITVANFIDGAPFMVAYNSHRIDDETNQGRHFVILNVVDTVRSWYTDGLKPGDEVIIREDLDALIDDDKDAATGYAIWAPTDAYCHYAGKRAIVTRVMKPKDLRQETIYTLLLLERGLVTSSFIWTERMFEQENDFNEPESCITNLYSA